jgi:hypothetical protein
MTSRETVVNKPLSGLEIKEILRAHFDRLLENEGMLGHYIAYGRLAYTITLQLHTDNPMQRETSISASSQKRNDQPGVEAPPLGDPSPGVVVAGSRLDYSIDSPNEERLRHGLTLPVVVRGQDGTTQTEQVKYPPQPELGAGDVKVADVSAATREAWKVPAPTP